MTLRNTPIAWSAAAKAAQPRPVARPRKRTPEPRITTGYAPVLARP